VSSPPPEDALRKKLTLRPVPSPFPVTPMLPFVV